MITRLNQFAFSALGLTRSKKKWLLLAVLALVSLMLAGYFSPSFAATDPTSGSDDDVLRSAVQLVSAAIQTANVFLWPFLLIIGDLMDSDLIVGPGMESRLLAIWVQVRNVVNILFVLVLLVIAFYNVLGIGGGEGNLALKTALPKLVLGLVLVNFTYMGGRVILDLTNVATTAAFALPEVVDDFTFEEERSDFANKVCMKDYKKGIKWTEKDARIYVKPFCEFDEDADEYTGDINSFAQVTYFEELNANNMGLVMAVNMGALSSLELLDVDKVDDYMDLFVSSVFSLIMFLVFVISYVTLGVLLFTRVIVLWIAMSLSPLIALVYVVPQIKEWMGGAGDIQSKIIKHLISPIIVGLTFTLGYLMISAWDGIAGTATSEASIKFNELMAEEFLLSGVDDLPKFMIALASVVIVWTGVFAAASGTYAETITNGIKGFGEQIGGALAKAPLALPTVPIFTKDGDTVPGSVLAVAGLAKQGLNYMEYGMVQKQMQDIAKGDSTGFLNTILNGGSSEGLSAGQSAVKIENILSGSLAEGGHLSTLELKNVGQSLMNIIDASNASDGEKERLTELAKNLEQSPSVQNLNKLFDDQGIESVLKSHSTALNAWQNAKDKENRDMFTDSEDVARENKKKMDAKAKGNDSTSSSGSSSAGALKPEDKKKIDDTLNGLNTQVEQAVAEVKAASGEDKKKAEAKLTKLTKQVTDEDVKGDKELQSKKDAILKKTQITEPSGE